MDEIETARRRADRERKARKTAEAMLEERSLELYRANQVLKQAREDLEQRVEERTEQLAVATEMLRQAAHQAQMANRAKSDFLARMSHEIRTPMNCVIGLAEVLSLSNLDSNQKEYVDTIHVSACALLELINDILDFSRIEAGKLAITSRDFDLRQQLDEIVRSLAIKAHEKQLELVLDVAPDVPQVVTGDALRIRQVLVNLISNAIKFTEQGCVSLTVNVLHAAESFARLQFLVRDTGIGIDSQRLTTIFEPFVQGEEETTPRFGGSGLGLAICQQLVTLMHGSLAADSTVGTGSDFTLTIELPVVRVKDSADQSTLEVIRNHRILLVSRSRELAAQIVRMSRAWQCHIETCSDASTAAERIRQRRRSGERYDIILFDTEFQSFSIDELAASVKQYQPASTVILLIPIATEMSPDGSANPIHAEGIDLSLYTKPVQESRLLRHLARQLGAPDVSQDSVPLVSSLPDGLDVLLVDDTAVNRMVVKSMLQYAGSISVTEASHGREALTLASERRFDVVLMDLRMPVMGGLEATRRIRELDDPELASVPIIALTANALESERNRCLAAGMVDFLTKPFSRQQLVDSIIQNLRRRASDGPSNDPTGVFSSGVPEPEGEHAAAETEIVQPEESGSDQRAFDSSVALSQTGRSLKLLTELSALFDDTFITRNAQLTQAIAAANREDIEFCAHSIKGSLRTLGGIRAAQTAALLEQNSAEQSVGQLGACHAALTDEVMQFQRELQDFLQAQTAHR